MNKYSVIMKDAKGMPLAGRVVLGYNEQEGFLESVTIEMEMTRDQAIWFWKVFLPAVEDDAKNMKSNRISITPILTKIGFVDFWNAYGYKVGNKVKCEKLWKALNDADRTKCFSSIGKYNQYITLKGIDKIYPERYLSQRRFDNEFKY